MADRRVPATVVRYVALGDSHTIGTSVPPRERFPDQLVASMAAHGHRLQLVANLGVNGYTSADVVMAELPVVDALDPGFVTLLIGVNDVVQGLSLATYEANVAAILETLLARLPARRLVTIAIPDYTVTPAGGEYGDPGTQRAAIDAANRAMARLSVARSVPFVDIVDISRSAAEDPTLVASDGLHPSGAQYTRWVGRIRPVLEALLAT
jgi:lysophospholipase L1-like esterase